MRTNLTRANKAAIRQTRTAADLRDAQQRAAEASSKRVPLTTAEATRQLVQMSGASVTSRGQTYSPFSGQSFFKDLISARQGHPEARERLRIHGLEQQFELRQREQAAEAAFASSGFVAETRAINTLATSGGEFVPPITLLEAWAPMARAGRVFADGFNRQPLPPGTNSINIPRASTGSSVAAQTANNAAVSSTDMITNSISSPVITITGQTDLSLQLLEMTAPALLDGVIMKDLLDDFNAKLDVQCLNGSGGSGQATGLLNVGSINTVTFTTGSPTLILAWPKLANALSLVGSARLLPATAWYMHPRRWDWCMAALDAQNHPMIDTSDSDTPDDEYEAQAAGTLMKLPVFQDANIPTTIGGTQDIIVASKMDDHWLWESPMFTNVLLTPLSTSLGARVQLHAYVALTAGRYPSGSATVGGSGLTTPTF